MLVTLILVSLAPHLKSPLKSDSKKQPYSPIVCVGVAAELHSTTCHAHRISSQVRSGQVGWVQRVATTTT